MFFFCVTYDFGIKHRIKVIVLFRLVGAWLSSFGRRFVESFLFFLFLVLDTFLVLELFPIYYHRMKHLKRSSQYANANNFVCFVGHDDAMTFKRERKRLTPVNLWFMALRSVKRIANQLFSNRGNLQHTY